MLLLLWRERKIDTVPLHNLIPHLPQLVLQIPASDTPRELDLLLLLLPARNELFLLRHFLPCRIEFPVYELHERVAACRFRRQRNELDEVFLPRFVQFDEVRQWLRISGLVRLMVDQADDLKLDFVVAGSTWSYRSVPSSRRCGDESMCRCNGLGTEERQ